MSLDLAEFLQMASVAGLPVNSKQTVFVNGAQAPNGLNTGNNQVAKVTIPGGTMGKNSMLRIVALFSFPNNTNTKTARVYFGGTVIYQAGFTANTLVKVEIEIQNRNSLTSQVVQGSTQASPGNVSSPLVTLALDTTQDQLLEFYAQVGTATDQMNLERYSVEVIG